MQETVWRRAGAAADQPRNFFFPFVFADQLDLFFLFSFSFFSGPGQTFPTQYHTPTCRTCTSSRTRTYHSALLRPSKWPEGTLTTRQVHTPPAAKTFQHPPAAGSHSISTLNLQKGGEWRQNQCITSAIRNQFGALSICSFLQPHGLKAKEGWRLKDGGEVEGKDASTTTKLTLPPPPSSSSSSLPPPSAPG